MIDIYDKNILEFATVAAEYCGFVEKSSEFTKADFINKSQKLLALLYLKGSLLPLENEYESDEFLEQFVSEFDWQQAQNLVSTVLGSHDSYFETIDPQNMSNSEEYTVCISECYADIYQDLKNFIERYKLGVDEIMRFAISECALGFSSLWGIRSLAILQELHLILYSDDDLNDDQGSAGFNNFESEF